MRSRPDRSASPGLWRLLRQLRCGERGSVAVEVGLVMSIIVIMIVGTFEFALVLYEQMQLEKGVQSGAHYALLSQTEANDTDEIIAIVRREVGDDEGLSVTATNYCECPGEGEVPCNTGRCADDSIPAVFLEVAASREHGFLNGLLGRDNITLSTAALVRAR